MVEHMHVLHARMVTGLELALMVTINLSLPQNSPAGLQADPKGNVLVRRIAPVMTKTIANANEIVFV